MKEIKKIPTRQDAEINHNGYEITVISHINSTGQGVGRLHLYFMKNDLELLNARITFVLRPRSNFKQYNIAFSLNKSIYSISSDDNNDPYYVLETSDGLIEASQSLANLTRNHLMRTVKSCFEDCYKNYLIEEKHLTIKSAMNDLVLGYFKSVDAQIKE
ncbi:hypothetical protein VB319_18770 [Vibrio parahaemolyticus]|uniref:hypothetical protein n=1 Tax=Vibrio parahaemolyticus TaxID=670 RepID=UPI002B1FF024|nr:hypothetical protein [Vibrio parahaemolyticus]MEA5356013.1 hypothetical protein [Vibrio parahaemolyticus]